MSKVKKIYAHWPTSRKWNTKKDTSKLNLKRIKDSLKLNMKNHKKSHKKTSNK